jgi:ABC-type dipeptide/oligopeptide/nickel transport system permease subunit
VTAALGALHLGAVAVAVIASLVAVAGMLLERREPQGRKIPWRQTDGYRFLTNVPFVIGTLGILVIAFIALFGPQLAPSDPQAQRVIIFYPDASFAAPPTPPDQYNLLGTDPIGRDQLSRLLWGARLTLTVVLLGLLGRGALAVILGVLAGWRRGSWVDHAVGYVTNAVSGLPQLMLALLLVIALQQMGQGITGFVLALALVGWAELAQFVRAEVVRVVATPHVEAARTLGATGVHVVRVHVLRDLAPQLLGLLALEAGSVLLLLAELGFIGFFIAGGVFYVSDSGAPILPIRDRAPEWGQMLAGARQYAFDHQYVAFVPGVVVVSAVLAFNLFAEGLRTASDPFSPSRLSPRALGGIARALMAGGLIAAVGFGYVSVTSTSISFGDGLRSARQAAERVLPDSEFVAGVVSLQSSVSALAKPSKLTYYFRDERDRIVHVSFIGVDANAMDVKLDSNEDGLLVEALGPLDVSRVVDWEVALQDTEERFGRAFRERGTSYLVKLVLVQDAGTDRPLYRVQYGREVGGTQIEARVDATTGSSSIPREHLAADAASRARILLGGEARLVGITASWLSERLPAQQPIGSVLPPPSGYGAERPALFEYVFVRGDISHPLTVSVSYRAGSEGIASATPTGSFGGNVDSRTLPSPPFTIGDLEAAFAKAEEAGLRERREAGIAEGFRQWSQSATAGVFSPGGGAEGDWRIYVTLFMNDGRTSRGATFEYDPQTGEIRETDRRFR